MTIKPEVQTPEMTYKPPPINPPKPPRGPGKPPGKRGGPVRAPVKKGRS